MTARYACCDDRRREAVREHATLNGIDYVEVVDDPMLPDDERQRTLLVAFVKSLHLAQLLPENFRIEGGERRHVRATAVAPEPGRAEVLRVELDRAGDFSPYTLRLVRDPEGDEPPTGFDPQLVSVVFSFKVNCPSDLDCRTLDDCPEPVRPTPDLDYLAKDFESFRRLMLDRLALTVPEWTERNVADVGVTLVELLAYVGDHLSYEQDAVANEAYLGTARRRVSIRRHARLVDYALDEGSNARAFVQLVLGANHTIVQPSTRIIGHVPGMPTCIAPNSSDLDDALKTNPPVFETMNRVEVRLFQEHNRLQFYTWGARECCLPKGATRATLRKSYPDLAIGDVLVFVEELGPSTGLAADADPTHRHAVRLTRVTIGSDPLGGRFDAIAPNDAEAAITEIEWAEEDALPFPLCLSVRLESSNGDRDIEDVSVALGNIVLCDHGHTFTETLATVPEPKLAWVRTAAPHCEPHARTWVPARFRPRLGERPLTHAVPYQQSSAWADLAAHGHALPAIFLSDGWLARGDLLSSRARDREFVVEIESDGWAYLRFGDGRFGERPTSGTKFVATYRVGNGPAGNVGAEALRHVVVEGNDIQGVRNPLAARGGRAPESIERARQHAPTAFQKQKRAITPEDYAAVAALHPDVQRAAATFRWTGSWYTVFLTIDRFGGRDVDAPFRDEMRALIEPYRLQGHDLEIDHPRFVSLEIGLHVCVAPGFFRHHVRQVLTDVLGNRRLSDGGLGMFHPDRWTFAQTVYMSQIVAAAQSIPGVEAVKIETFRRQASSDPLPSDGELHLARLEIARLENDPNFPDHGILRLSLEGGK